MRTPRASLREGLASGSANGRATSVKKLFYLGLVALICFEIANVYLIMPLPFSQRIDTIG